MRIAIIIICVIVGLFAGDMLGQPAGYWHGMVEETIAWAWWTGGCGVAGAFVGLLVPLRVRK